MPTAEHTPTVAEINGKSGLLIAENGKAALPIVISTQASDATKQAAAELAGYLKQITGATFAIQTGDGSIGIVLGTMSEFPPPAGVPGTLAPALEVRGFDGKEAYAIRTGKERVLLIGASDLGASHAANRFLELLGCRWFFPAKAWEVVPHLSTLRVNVSETDRPAILSRRIWYAWGYFHGAERSEAGRSAFEDYDAWARHNRMAESFKVNAGHAYQNIIRQNKAAFAAHPEYYALVKDKDGNMIRKGPQIELGNPAVRQLVLDYARQYFKDHPDADMVSVDPSDGGGYSQSPESKVLGSPGDGVFGMANEVVKMLQKEFPGKMVGILAYNWHCEPPSFALEPNVHVQLTNGFISGKYSLTQLYEMWPQKCRNMGYYDYFSVWLWDHDMLPGGSGGNIAYLQKQIPFYAAHNATSISAESSNNWGPNGLGYYIANRLMWNPRADVQALLDDFYDKAFGPAAPAMRKYYERLQSDKPIISRGFIGLLFQDVQNASTLARDRPDVLARLDALKEYLRYVHLYWLYDHETDKAKKQDALLALVTHSYRARWSYMMHWAAVRQNWAKQFVIAGKEPWAGEKPYTHEEIERMFQEGRAYFQPQDVTELHFSSDLVPVRFPGDARGKGFSHTWQGAKPRYALYSVDGEPLHVTVIPGTIRWYRNRHPASYRLSTPRAEVVAEGSLPLDGEQHALEFKVPHAGLYYFDFYDSKAGWRISGEKDQLITLVMEKGNVPHHTGGMSDLYFYVPKGTQQIQYYWGGSPHWVNEPDGKTRHRVETSGEIITIPVPAGTDGQCWSFSFQLRPMWFYNIPNVLASSPNALLLPREVAEKDGLQIRAAN